VRRVKGLSRVFGGCLETAHCETSAGVGQERRSLICRSRQVFRNEPQSFCEGLIASPPRRLNWHVGNHPSALIIDTAGGDRTHERYGEQGEIARELNRHRPAIECARRAFAKEASTSILLANRHEDLRLTLRIVVSDHSNGSGESGNAGARFITNFLFFRFGTRHGSKQGLSCPEEPGRYDIGDL